MSKVRSALSSSASSLTPWPRSCAPALLPRPVYLSACSSSCQSCAASSCLLEPTLLQAGSPMQAFSGAN
eukprot:jgi/Chlat1/6097/Chrsp40S05674